MNAGPQTGSRAGARTGLQVGLRVVAICVLLGALAGLVLLVVRPSLNPAHHIRPLPLIALGWIAFLTAAFLLRKVPVRLAVALIMLGGIGIQIAATRSPTRSLTRTRAFIAPAFRTRSARSAAHPAGAKPG